jgi:hypothetical protein
MFSAYVADEMQVALVMCPIDRHRKGMGEISVAMSCLSLDGVFGSRDMVIVIVMLGVFQGLS